MKNNKNGYAYLSVLVFAACMGILASALGAVIYSRESRLEKEQELLFRGLAYKSAIESYYQASQTKAEYPDSLYSLTNDPRFSEKRHIRRLYPDPINNDNWTLIYTKSGKICGVASSASGKPIMQNGFPESLKSFTGSQNYSDWQFVYKP